MLCLFLHLMRYCWKSANVASGGPVHAKLPSDNLLPHCIATNAHLYVFHVLWLHAVNASASVKHSAVVSRNHNSSPLPIGRDFLRSAICTNMSSRIANSLHAASHLRTIAARMLYLYRTLSSGTTAHAAANHTDAVHGAICSASAVSFDQ